MVIDHIRCEQTRDSTRGILIIQDGVPEWICDVLEDGARKQKIRGLTRIDLAIYHIVPIQYGRFYARYQEAHGHKFAIALMDKPGTDTAGQHVNVRVHKGNTVADTDGCPLVGQIRFDGNAQKFVLLGGTSTPAYLRLYNLLEGIYDADKNQFTEPAFWRITEQFK